MILLGPLRRCFSTFSFPSQAPPKYFSTSTSSPPTSTSFDVVICGAGVAGIATAYFLKKMHGISVALVDPRPPLSFTSAMSTECYRNFWTNPSMFAFMERSIDLLEDLAAESRNTFHLSRPGYLYLATTREGVEDLRGLASAVASHGVDRLREYSGPDPVAQGYQPHAHLADYLRELLSFPLTTDRATYPLRGIDFLEGNKAIQKVYPFLGPEVQAALHARRCGWLSAQEYGMFLWKRCKKVGTQLFTGTVTKVEKTDDAISGVTVSLPTTGQG